MRRQVLFLEVFLSSTLKFNQCDSQLVEANAGDNKCRMDDDGCQIIILIQPQITFKSRNIFKV